MANIGLLGKRRCTLDGIPIVIKDNFITKGIPTTAGSKFLQDFVPPYHSTVVKKLLQAGAIIVGKANMDEFGMGSGGVNSYYGPSFQSSQNEKLLAGGSSSGCASAITHGFCFAYFTVVLLISVHDNLTRAVASDTGGSARLPASYCGLVGFKPSYGRVSRYGLVAYCSSLDCPSVIAKSVADAVCVYEVIRGSDVEDYSTLAISEEHSNRRNASRDIKIGIPKEFRISELSKDVLACWQSVVRYLQDKGFTCKVVSIPTIKYSLAAYYVLALTEASSNLARYSGIQYGCCSHQQYPYHKTRHEGLGSVPRQRILAGTFCLLRETYQSYYFKARQIQQVVRNELNAAFQEVDVLVGPTAFSTAPTLEEWRSSESVYSFCNDVLTVPASLAGLPCISVPAGTDDKRKPIGIQVIGKKGDEETLVEIARQIEESQNKE
ncbi:hypothetical protein Zmor_016423 [Zophobas morio]|uniref:Glutamyl-tRNA(Gln) amidotransferase subunit A, mitochondrial n=1 Tax=Zophobas morio TaxID=2755281 RepID=A0AA38M0K3_9CUCU|nr:hypothetical protein Zmor_016423 [Zophobas morio]